ncbi:MAG: hypothetical protein ABI137_15055 [Antricoccus sp.]
MPLALAAVLVAAICSGGAAVLQAGAARRLPPADSLAAGFMVRLLRNPMYLLALVLIISSFGLSILALRTLPLFVVQAGRASSLAVTALLGVLVLGVRLRRTEVVAVLGIAAGLVLLGLSSGPQGRPQLKLPGEFALLAAVLVIGIVAAVIVRMDSSARGGLYLSILAGCCFGLLALGARLLPSFDPVSLLQQPIAWAMGISGVLGLLLGAIAFQRASVLAATGGLVATETVVGSILGVLVAGDHPAEGTAALAVGGLALTLIAALLLARFGGGEGHRDLA